MLRSYTTIISYNNLHFVTPPYYDERSDSNCLCTQMICDWKVRFSLQWDSFTWEFTGRIFVFKVITLAPNDTASHTMFCKQTNAYKIWGLRQIFIRYLLQKRSRRPCGLKRNSVGMWRLACWDSTFEKKKFRVGYGRLFCCDVCRQVEVSAKS